MITCRVKPGQRFGARKQFGPGDLVEVSAGALRGFSDKLERVLQYSAFVSEVEYPTVDGPESEVNTEQDAPVDLDEAGVEDEPEETALETETEPVVEPRIKRRKSAPQKVAEGVQDAG